MTALPEPRANPHLFGHEAIEAAMAATARSGRMHHAWLITGPEGIGKATLAFRFARWLFAGLPDGSLAVDPTSPAFRRVAVGSHADLLTVERAWDPKRKRVRGEIVVDDVRRVSDFMRLTPAEGGWRVVVLDGADDMNRNAANGLLKILEEPPPRSVLLLTCASPGRLLPTIRSRCRRLPMRPLEPAAMAEVLARALPETSSGERARLATLGEGSPGRALELASGGGVGVADLVGDVFAAMPGVGLDRANVVADAIARDEDAFSTFMDLLRAGLATAVRDAARGHADPGQAKLLGDRPLDAWVDVWHALGRLQGETEGLHLDRRHAIVASFGLLRDGP